MDMKNFKIDYTKATVPGSAYVRAMDWHQAQNIFYKANGGIEYSQIVITAMREENHIQIISSEAIFN